MTHRYDFSRFKSDINLTQYAAHLGYEVDKKKSTRSSIAMRNGGDKIIISKRGHVPRARRGFKVMHSGFQSFKNRHSCNG